MSESIAREAAELAVYDVSRGHVEIRWDDAGRFANAAIDAYLSALSSHPDEEMVTTVEQITALPVDSVILSNHRIPFQLRTHDPRGPVLWGVNGQPQPARNASMLLPARVIYRPVPADREGDGNPHQSA